MDLDPESNYYQEREAELLAARDAKITQLTEALSASSAVIAKLEAELRIAKLEAELRALREENERLRAERSERDRYLLADEERRKLTGDALLAESDRSRAEAERDAARREKDDAIAVADDAIKLAIDRRAPLRDPGCFAHINERQRRETDELRARLAKLRSGA